MTGAAAPGEPPAAPGPFLLVVDDNTALLDGIRMACTRRHLSCQLASSGSEALAVARVSTPSAILLDLFMPQESAAACLRELRALASRIPIILISGHPDLVDRARALGADGYLAKPFSPAE